MKYIDADCLRTEIENLIEKYSSVEAKGVLQEGYKGGRLIGYKDVINKLNSLQQEQEQYVIGGQVFGATDIEQLYKGKVYIVSKLVQDKEFGISPGERVKMLLIKD